MPAPKPVGLHTRHSTKPEIEQRAAQEEALTGGTKLPAMPRTLKDHKVAQAAWRRLMREFGRVDAVLVTRLDMDQLIDYCILMEQIGEIDTMRKAAYDSLIILIKARDDALANGRLEDAGKLAGRVVDANDSVIQLDSRSDRKRDLLLKLRQSLYLTPKARAGAAPKTKVEEPPEDPFEKLLNGLPSRVPLKSGELSDDEA